MARILWLDDDAPQIRPYAQALASAGHEVEVVRKLSEGKTALLRRQPDLLILDVKIHTFSREEEEDFPPRETREGQLSGLVFYRRMREWLPDHSIKTLVVTRYINDSNRHELEELFGTEGIPRERICALFDLADVRKCRDKVEEVLAETS